MEPGADSRYYSKDGHSQAAFLGLGFRVFRVWDVGWPKVKATRSSVLRGMSEGLLRDAQPPGEPNDP